MKEFFGIPPSAEFFLEKHLFLIQSHLKKQREKEEEREAEKANQMTLIIRTLNSLGKLTVANSIALRDGHTNGELRNALGEYRDVEKDLFDYLTSVKN